MSYVYAPPLTIEERSLAAEDKKHGFEEIPESCPPVFARHMVECRRAFLEGRPEPAPSPELRAQRAADALHFEQRLFPTPPPAKSRRLPNVCLEDVLAVQATNELRTLRAKAAKQAADIEAEQRAAEQIAEQERDIRNWRREAFPWEVRD